jgi:hypothetical protein
MVIAFVATQPAALFPQAITNHVLLWALISAAIGALLGLLLKPKPSFSTRWASAIGLAMGAAALAFGAFELVSSVFHTHFGIWIVSLKPMTPWAEISFALYLLPFAAFFLATFRGLLQRIAVIGESRLAQYATAITAMAGGMALLCAVLYVPLFATGLLPFPPAALQAVIALQFVPILAICAIIVM